MDAFHSQKGREMYKRLPASTPETSAVLEASTAPYSQTEINFRKLRDELESNGWWERDYVHEAKLLGIWESNFLTRLFTHGVIIMLGCACAGP